MQNPIEYIQKSMELNLFFLRIMKEHALFMQLGFTPKNKALADEAAVLRKQIADLLQRVVIYAKGYVSPSVMKSGELFTRFTLEAERQTQLYTDAPPQIDLELTGDEYGLVGNSMPPASLKVEIDEENRLALGLMMTFLAFKRRVREAVFACRIFTLNNPLFYNHIIHEVEHYIHMLQKMMSGEYMHDAAERAEHEVFWNRIMEQHAEFIDGKLDPSERALKQSAAAFARQYEKLGAQEDEVANTLQSLNNVTAQSEKLTYNFRNFKVQGTQGILTCKVRSVILPLLADHVLREANHYLRMLYEAQK